MKLGSTVGPRDLHVFGALIPVTLRPIRGVGLESERAQGAIFLVDTGATHSVVEDTVLRALGVRPLREGEFTTADGNEVAAMVYKIEIEIALSDGTSGGRLSSQAEVFGADWSRRPPRKHAGLLGRDFLKNTRLDYDGPRGCFELHCRP